MYNGHYTFIQTKKGLIPNIKNNARFLRLSFEYLFY